MPQALTARRRTPADCRAVGAFLLRKALLVNFLAPVPGVLDYRGGEVFDLRSGQLVLPR